MTAALTLAVILGGVKSVARVSAAVVPGEASSAPAMELAWAIPPMPKEEHTAKRA